MKSLERLIERLVLASRWLLVVFYLGLALALAVYGFTFLLKVWSFVKTAPFLDETDTLLKVLSLIDGALVASLLVMVIISGYENFVSDFDEEETRLNWLGKVDMNSLKIKVASTIVAISSIHLLQVFLNINSYDNIKIMWLTIMHMVFVVSALLLAVLDRLTNATAISKKMQAPTPYP